LLLREQAAKERDKATTAATVAQANEAIARANETRALAALSDGAFNQHYYADAVKLALAAWPRNPSSDRPKLRAAINALGQAQPLQRETIPPLRREGRVNGAAFNGDASRILTWSDDGTARLWDAATGKEVVALRHEGGEWCGVQRRREPDPDLVL
jgi:predicted oxidoreductase (fatty acid repression mutant protein)